MGRKIKNDIFFDFTNDISLLKQILDNAQVAIVIADEKRIIHRINPEFTKIFGYTLEEAVGRPIEELIITEEALNQSLLVKDRVEKGEGTEYETKRRTKDGKIIDVICRVSPILSNGRMMGGFSFYSDITQKKQVENDLKKAHEELERRVEARTRELKTANKNLEREIAERKQTDKALIESEERYRTAIEHSNDGVGILQDLTHVFVNQRFAEIYGYETVDEVIGIELKDIIHPDDYDSVVERGARRQRGEILGESYEIKGIKKDGTPVYVEVSVTTTSYKGKPAALVYTRDVTDRKKAAQELQNALRAADEANMAKSEFLANMSHEIRTPLNGVMGVLNLLLSTDLTSEQLDLIDTGKRSADSLLTVINDILDFSKIEAGELDLEELNFNLRNAVAEVVELPAMRANEKDVEFAYEIHHEVPSLLRGDPGRLRQVLLNLTNNAIKFTQKGEVVLRVSLENETKTHVKLAFTVSDTGIGIHQEKLGSIFESFKQTDSSTTRIYGGTGLGLSISKRLVELMNGEIRAKSVLNEGSTFWFTVLFEKQKNINEKKPFAPLDIRGKRFLIVDDNKTNLNILKGYLESWGCFCDVAESGEIALSLMNAVAKVNSPFDAAIIDMRMPGMDGAELGKKIKNDPLLNSTTMVMLTSQGLRGDASRMEKIGFSAYLTKPIRRSQLFDCLVTVLSHGQDGKTSIKSQIITKHSITEEKWKNKLILLVEDNIVNQKLAMRMIEKFGFKVDSATNGMEAIKALESFKYDIVLMDVQMPGMDGFQATKIIRNPESNVLDHNIPIIAMTAHAMKGDRERCIAAGMNDYISKPVQPQELLNVIEKAL
jgi:two-component system sensor histidine kinase/response regulator